ncbi:MAG: hypothetical protein ACUVUE_01790 [Candidatus Bathycorpusculaceae bacterium]
MPNKKGASILVFIILLVISAVIAGLITYMFTIAPFIQVPEGAAISITDVYIDRENASSFVIGVLNPSYSPASATITRIAISLKGGSQLYDITQTEPEIGNGIVLSRDMALNITCFAVKRDGKSVKWGEVAGEFAGETITVHVFSPDALAANIERTLPNIKLDLSKADFDPEASFKTFNITVKNPNSDINLTISEISVPGIDLTENDIAPKLPKTVATNETVHFACNGNWYELENATVMVSTKEGYIFSKNFTLKKAYAKIQNVIFDEDDTDHFNVKVSNLAESANYVNVTRISATIENGTIIQRDYSAIGIMPNATSTFKFNWPWREYREKNITVTVHLLQDFETENYTAKTPPPIIIKVLNPNEAFNLKDQEHFNITLQNHPASIEAVNITQIIAKTIGGVMEVINATEAEPRLPYGPVEPGQIVSLYCRINKWTAKAGRNMTLTVYVISTEEMEEYSSDFVFLLPTAEIDITNVTHTTVNDTKYLNIAVENSEYSIWNMAISKVIIIFENQYEPLEYTFPKNQLVIKPDSEVFLLCAFDWEARVGERITVTVSTSEGVEASWQGTSW